MAKSWEDDMREMGCPDELHAYFSNVFINFIPMCDYCDASIDSCDSSMEDSDKYFLFAAAEMKKNGWVVPSSNQLSCKSCAEKFNLRHNEKAT